MGTFLECIVNKQACAPSAQNLRPPATAPQHNSPFNLAIITNTRRPAEALPPATKNSSVTPLSPTTASTISAGRNRGRGSDEDGGTDTSATDNGNTKVGGNRRELRAPPEASSQAKRSLALSISEDRLSWKLDMGKHEGGNQRQQKADREKQGEQNLQVTGQVWKCILFNRQPDVLL